MAAHVCVIGIGGVGSWTVEALARAGVGAITLVDLDEVCVSNVNRQLPALTQEVGRPKVQVMKERVFGINPDCRVAAVEEFFTESNAAQILATRYDCLIDGIDAISKKALLLARARQQAIPTITLGAAGGRSDPTAIRVADLAMTSGDRLLRQVRKALRTDHGFTRKIGERFGIECIFSTEEPIYPQSDGSVCATKQSGSDLRLNCNSGYGTAAFVTGTFGFVAAGRAVKLITEAIVRKEP